MSKNEEIKLQEIGGRFKQMRIELGFDTQEEFGVELGARVNRDESPIDKATISRYENGKANISNKVLVELYSHYRVNKTWLESGTGEMFLQTNESFTQKPYHQRRFESMVNDDQDIKPTGRDISLQKAIGEDEDLGLIYVPIRAQAGYTRNFTDRVYIDQLERVYIPNSPYRGDDYRYFEVEGDSMYPTLEDGVWVVAQRVPPESWDTIFNFYIYVIVNTDQILVKRLFKLDADNFVMISDNEELYPQFKMEKERIKELWVVKRKMDWNMAAPKNFEIKVS